MNDYLRLNEKQVSFDEFGDEVVVVHFLTGRYYSVTGSAAQIWRLLVGGHSVSAISDHLERAYADCDVGSVQDYIRQIIEEDLLLPHGTPGTEPQSFPEVVDPLPFQPPLLRRYDDMQDLILLDPIHDVDDTGWPHKDAV